MLLNLTIRSLNKNFFHSNKVEKISFNTQAEGIIEILYNHESYDFFLKEGIIEIKLTNELLKIYNGVGIVNVHENNIEICAFPIVYEKDINIYSNLGEYDRICLKAWKMD